METKAEAMEQEGKSKVSIDTHSTRPFKKTESHPGEIQGKIDITQGINQSWVKSIRLYNLNVYMGGGSTPGLRNSDDVPPRV